MLAVRDILVRANFAIRRKGKLLCEPKPSDSGESDAAGAREPDCRVSENHHDDNARNNDLTCEEWERKQKFTDTERPVHQTYGELVATK